MVVHEVNKVGISVDTHSLVGYYALNSVLYHQFAFFLLFLYLYHDSKLRVDRINLLYFSNGLYRLFTTINKNENRRWRSVEMEMTHLRCPLVVIY